MSSPTETSIPELNGGWLITQLKTFSGAIDYNGSDSCQVVFRLTNNRTLRFLVGPDDDFLRVDQYAGLPLANGKTDLDYRPQLDSSTFSRQPDIHGITAEMGAELIKILKTLDGAYPHDHGSEDFQQVVFLIEGGDPIRFMVHGISDTLVVGQYAGLAGMVPTPVQTKSSYQLKYEDGEYPLCYRPAPPFYDICNAHQDCKSCQKCFARFGFTDSIE